MQFLFSTQRGLILSLLGSVALIDICIALICFPGRQQPASTATHPIVQVQARAGL